MIRFLTPVRAAVPKDIEARSTLLHHAPEHLRTGFELILLDDDYKEPETIVTNARNAQHTTYSVHVPFPQIGGAYHEYDVRTPAGQDKIRATASIAQALGVKKVVVHSQLAYTFTEWKSEYNDPAWRDALFAELFSIFHNIQAEYPEQRLCLENMPLPLFADTVGSATDMRYNPCLVTFGDMQRAVRAGVSVTWDICHYDMMRRLWQTWQNRYGAIDPKAIQNKEYIVGVYPEEAQPGYREVIATLGSGIEHIHLADSSGLWQNTTSMPAGGLALGAGDQNPEELMTLLHYLESNLDKEYTINLEVKDKDMQAIQETAQSLRYLAQLLYGQQT